MGRTVAYSAQMPMIVQRVKTLAEIPYGASSKSVAANVNRVSGKIRRSMSPVEQEAVERGEFPEWLNADVVFHLMRGGDEVDMLGPRVPADEPVVAAPVLQSKHLNSRAVEQYMKENKTADGAPEGCAAKKVFG